MKIKIDENLPVELMPILRELGHDVDSVLEEGLQGALDPQVLAAAHADSRILFTLDRGIGDIRTYPPGNYSGIVIFIIKKPTRQQTLEFIRPRLTQIFQQSLNGKLLIVSINSLRIRH